MFTQKQKSLFEKNPVQKATSENPFKIKTATNSFVKAALQKDAEGLSGNGALKYRTTGNDFVDQFSNISAYKPSWNKFTKEIEGRSFNTIAADCEILWANNKLLTVMFIFFIRTITRIVQLFDGYRTTESQKGAGLKHESIFRMIWLHTKSPDTFWKNIGLFISIGSWNDIFTMLQYDLMWNGWNGRILDWNKFGDLILTSLENPNTSELVKKWLPRIKSKNQCTTLESQADTLIGKWICSLLFGNKPDNVSDKTFYGSTYKKYRLLKSKGTAHTWQQLISKRQFDRIDFSKIHGRALNLLVRGKFLKNQKLTDKYEAWATKPETTIKYTGFVHELFKNLPHSLSQLSVGEQATINKQFDTLVEKGGEMQATKSIVVRDTSSSMGAKAIGTDMSCFNVAKALALYFSSFLEGNFKDAWIEFNSSAKMHVWKGNTPLEKWYNDTSSFYGSTDFQSVISLFVSMLKKGVPESEFPTRIICISDLEFNPSSQLNKTNVSAALTTLKKGGFSQEYVDNFSIVLWNLNNKFYKNKTSKFETYGNVKNVYYFPGYEPSIISFLTGKVETAEDLFLSAMNQEILNMIEI